MEIAHFRQKLAEALNKPLPGMDAQYRLAPQHRPRVNPLEAAKTKEPAPRHSAVLVPIFLNNGDLHMVLTQRQEYKGVHSGQISFPGGRREGADRDDVHTALREAREETNIQHNEVEVIGTLTQLYIPPSNFIVQPVVGYMAQRPILKPEEREVASIIEAPLKELFRNEIVEDVRIDLGPRGFIRTKALMYEGHTIWGATAMMLSELWVILENEGLI